MTNHLSLVKLQSYEIHTVNQYVKQNTVI